MSVSEETVQQVARLARLRLDPSEVDLFTGQLNAILEHMDELAAADRPDDAAVTTEVPAELRPDLPGHDSLAFPPGQLSPDFEPPFFTVPRLAAMESVPRA